MGLRKYKELDEYPKLRVLKKPGDKGNSDVRSFITLILVFAVVVSSIVIVSSNDESKKEETLQDFVERVIEEKPQKQEKFILGKTNPKIGKKIEELTGIDVSKYSWVVENYAIRHVLNKPAHSVSSHDFQKLYSVINTPDEIRFSDRQKSDVKYLEFYKDFDFKITCVMEVRVRQKELHIKTMFKNHIK